MGMGARLALWPFPSDPFERIAKPGVMSFDIPARFARRKMASRFVVRRQDNGGYCVWDNKADAVAQTENSQIRYESLEFNQALDAAKELNGPGRAPNPLPASDQKPSEKL
jgi:hypothetical protein